MFVYSSIFTGFGYSFSKFRDFAPAGFVGFRNYVDAFNNDDFLNSIKSTLMWVLMTATIPTFAGLWLAILVYYQTRGRLVSGVARTILFMPMMMSAVAVGLLWSLIYNPLLGLLNQLLHLIELIPAGTYVGFLENPNTALYEAFVPMVWQSAGFSMVIFSAALQGIPNDMREAAVLDGASKIKEIWHIVLPFIVPTIVSLVTVNMISGFKAFDLLNVLTHGGPADSTMIVSLYMYKQAFSAWKYGYSSAVAVVLFMSILVSVLLFSLAARGFVARSSK
ncbi:MAG: sugar ABC transporter permease [Spirochaetaceae bacterium]|nr:sugar ABC transporter permease [Spirochaetaceae bacterium]